MARATSINRRTADIFVAEANLSPRDWQGVERKNDCDYI